MRRSYQASYAVTGGCPLGVGTRCTASWTVQFREDDCRIRTGYAPTVMGTLRWAALNMVRTVQQHLESNESGYCATASDANRGSWPPHCLEPDFAFVLIARVWAGLSAENDHAYFRAVRPTPNLTVRVCCPCAAAHPNGQDA